VGNVVRGDSSIAKSQEIGQMIAKIDVFDDSQMVGRILVMKTRRQAEGSCSLRGADIVHL